jgi:hypothetical protein
MYSLHHQLNSKHTCTPPRGHAIFELITAMLAGSLRRQAAFAGCQARYSFAQQTSGAPMNRGSAAVQQDTLSRCCPICCAGKQCAASAQQHPLGATHSTSTSVWTRLMPANPSGVCAFRPPTRPRGAHTPETPQQQLHYVHVNSAVRSACVRDR